LTIVAVAAGIWVTVTGLAILAVPLSPIEDASPMIDDSVTLTQPLGEHVELFGQHPPPAISGHWKVECKHLGGEVQDASQSNVGSIESQQNIFDAV
jgi:hypothetical protein